MRRTWKYKVPFTFDVMRAGDDIDEGRATVEQARDAIAQAIREAANRFPKTEEGQEHTDEFIDIAEMIESQDELRQIDYHINRLYDYADDNRIWMDYEEKGPFEWRPRT